jgi:hypothetical protein
MAPGWPWVASLGHRLEPRARRKELEDKSAIAAKAAQARYQLAQPGLRRRAIPAHRLDFVIVDAVLTF